MVFRNPALGDLQSWPRSVPEHVAQDVVRFPAKWKSTAKAILCLRQNVSGQNSNVRCFSSELKLVAFEVFP